VSLLARLLRRKFVIWTLIVLPGLWPAWPFFVEKDPTALTDPLKFVLLHLGFTACLLLVAVLTFTPLRVLFPKSEVALALNRHRRLVGVSAFAYALLHFSVHVFYQYDGTYDGTMTQLGKELQKPFQLTGVSTHRTRCIDDFVRAGGDECKRRGSLAGRKEMEEPAPLRLPRRCAGRLPSGGRKETLSDAGGVDLRSAGATRNCPDHEAACESPHSAFCRTEGTNGALAIK
jgi:hypothetical protein